MFLFGVTGGIGSGKTTVSDFLKQKGVSIIGADPLAKELTNTLPEIRKALIEEFGNDVYTEAGELNKDKLSQLVFSDEKARHKVNSIIHPHVLDRIQTEAHRLKDEENQKRVGVEAALIYESKMHEMLAAVVVVTAPFEKRIEWIKKRNNLTREEILKRIDAQMPLAEKIRRADYVIENNENLDHLSNQVDIFFKWLSDRS